MAASSPRSRTRSRRCVDDAVAKTGAAGFTDALAMIDEADIDAVVIAAPTTAHADARACRNRARPAGPRGEATCRDGRGRDRARGCCACREAFHCRSATWSASTRPCSNWAAGLRKDGSVPSTRSRAGAPGPFPARIRDVGVTIDLATHDADILSWVAGERPTRVYAETAQRLHASNEDLLFGLLHFPSGATGMLDVNWLTPAKRRQLSVVGELGMFELDYLTQRLTFTSADVGSPTIIDGYATTFEGNVVTIDVASHEPLAAELDAFLDVARHGGRPVGRWRGWPVGACRSHRACSRPPPKATLSISPSSPN